MSEHLIPNTNIQTARDFAVKWKEIPTTRVIEEIASTHNETHRKTDPYTFHFDENGFYMLDTSFEKTHVRNTMEVSSQTGRIEGEMLGNLEEWFKNSSTGRVLWFSPPSPGKYPGWKLITHEIKQDVLNKTLHNRVDLFESSDAKVMQIIHDLFPQTSEIIEPENIRPHLFLIEDDFDLQEVFDHIKHIDPNSFAKNTGLSEEQLQERANHIANLIKIGVNEMHVALEMQKLGLLGKHNVSCPPSLSELLAGVSSGSDEYGSLEFACPSCGGTNTRPSGKLISNCQRCGADVTC